MADYYIRTPDLEESRGPFDSVQLLTLAEAGQITENSLYYDETKEEWIPLALNEQLKAEVFPARKKLALKVTPSGDQSDRPGQESPPHQRGIQVDDMLAAAEGDTAEMQHLKKKEQSVQNAASLSSSGIGLMMMLSAVTLFAPHFTIVHRAITTRTESTLINYPFILIGLIDFILATCLFLAATQIYPLLRGRAMLTFGFGVYIGWALNDPIVMLASAAAGIGIFYATLSQRYSIMLITVTLGVAGNASLAYLSIIGHFAGVFDSVHFNIISP